MSHTIKISSGAFESTGTTTIWSVNDLGALGYTHASGDIIRVTQGTSVWSAVIDSYSTGMSGNMLMISGTSGSPISNISNSDAVEILDSEGNSAWTGTDWEDLAMSPTALSVTATYSPQAGDTFTLSRNAATIDGVSYDAEQLDATVVSYDATGRELTVTSTGQLTMGPGGNHLYAGYPSPFNEPVNFVRSGNPIWVVQYITMFFDTSVFNSAPDMNILQDSGGSMSSKKFTSLIGRQEDTGSDGHRMPEEITAGDSLLLDLGASASFVVKGSAADAAVSDGDLGILTAKISSISNHDTDALDEGSANQYYLDSRARGSISLDQGRATDDAAGPNNGGAGDFSYDNVAGAFVYRGPSELWMRTEVRKDDVLNDEIAALADGNAFLSASAIDATGKRTESHVKLSTLQAKWSGDSAKGLQYDSAGGFSLDQDLTTTGNVQFGNVTLSGDLVVEGTMQTRLSQDVVMEDALMTLAKTASGAQQDPTIAGLRVARPGSSAELMPAGIVWQIDATDAEDGGAWHFVALQDSDASASPLNKLKVHAEKFIGDLEGDVTGTVSDISNHNTDALDEGATNLYYEDARVHAALSASKGVSYDNGGAFEADIDAASQLAITKANGLNIAFDVSNTAAQIGQLGYAGNEVSLTLAAKEVFDKETYGNGLSRAITAASDTQAIDLVLDPSGENAMSLSASGLLVDLSISTAAPSGNGSLVEQGGTFTFTPVGDGHIRSKVDAGAAIIDMAVVPGRLDSDSKISGFGYNSSTGVFTVSAMKVSEIQDLIDVESAVLAEPTGAAAIASLSKEPNGVVKVSAISADTLVKMSRESKDISDADLAAIPSQGGDRLVTSHYDDSTGVFTIKSLKHSELESLVEGFLSRTDAALDAAPTSSSERVAELSYADGVFGLKSASAAQILNLIGSDATAQQHIRDLFDAATNSQSGSMDLSYNSSTGIFTLDELSRPEIEANIEVENDADVSGDQQFGGISYVGAEGAKKVTLQRVKESEIRGVLSDLGSDSAFSYDDTTGVMGLSITDAQAHKAPTDADNNGFIDDATEALASVAWDAAGTITLSSAKYSDVRKAIKSTDNRLVYNHASGEMSLTADFEFDVVSADAFCDTGLSENAASAILVNELVSTSGEKAKARRNDWSMLGCAMEGIDQGVAMLSKVEMMPHGAIMEVSCDDASVEAGDWVYLCATDAKAGQVRKTPPTANDHADAAVVIVGRAMGDGDGSKVKISLCPQFLYNV